MYVPPLPEESSTFARAGNPHDVAELFQHLQVEHLQYREFPSPEELSAFDRRLTEGQRRSTSTYDAGHRSHKFTSADVRATEASSWARTPPIPKEAESRMSPLRLFSVLRFRRASRAQAIQADEIQEISRPPAAQLR